MAKAVWRRILGGALLALGLAACRREDGEPARLDAAWTEYRYQNFATAERLFRAVRDAAPARSPERFQARLGLAMVTDFRLPGGRPDLAAARYRELLDEVGPEAELAPVLLLLIGDCHFKGASPDFAAADACYREVMARHPGTWHADEAAIRHAYVLMRPATPAAFREALAWLEDRLAGHPPDAALGTMHAICARLAMALGERADLVAARDHLAACLADADGDGQYELVANQNNVADLMFQVADLSDTLGDRAAAVRHYRMLCRHTAVDARLARCRQRIAALEGSPE